MPAMSRNAPAIDLTAFRADQRAALDDELQGRMRSAAMTSRTLTTSMPSAPGA
jgi:hypothetical protein